MMGRFDHRATTFVRRALLAMVAGLLLISQGCIPPREIKVGALPIPDALPLRLGLHKPIFEENKLAMELIFYESPAELSAALAAGEIHAALIDLPSAILLNKETERVKVVRVAMRGSAQMAKFAILAAPNSTIRSPYDLKGADIAIPQEISAQYAADGLLSGAGLRPEEAHKVEVASSALGLKRLQEGEVPAALLSQPFILMAMKHGARVIIDDRNSAVTQSVIVYTQEEMERFASARRFLLAYEQAISELNTRGEQYRALMMEVARVPPEIQASFPMPLFPFPAEVPTESEVESVNTWLVRKNLLPQPIAYPKVADARFLPNALNFRPAICCG
jgi:NitT/TauT family transport system substrate-binding protein